MKWGHSIGILGLVAMAVGAYLGLVWSPPEVGMGDRVRMLHVHVPAAWVGMGLFAVCGLTAVAFLATGRRTIDWLVEATCEVGVLFAVLLCVLGSIFGRSTWGGWWDWDPRLTTSAVMVVSYAAILILRASIGDPDRRAVQSSAAAVLAFVNLPLVYYSVDETSLHQTQSNDMTMNDDIEFAMYFNTVAMALVAGWMVWLRWRIAQMQGLQELPEPLPIKEETAS